MPEDGETGRGQQSLSWPGIFTAWKQWPRRPSLVSPPRIPTTGCPWNPLDQPSFLLSWSTAPIIPSQFGLHLFWRVAPGKETMYSTLKLCSELVGRASLRVMGVVVQHIAKELRSEVPVLSSELQAREATSELFNSGRTIAWCPPRWKDIVLCSSVLAWGAG